MIKPWLQVDQLKKKFYADTASYDGTQLFYDWIRSEIRSKDCSVLNVGCGPASRDHRRLKNTEVGNLVGCDIDPSAIDNDEVNCFIHISDANWPIEPESFDLAYADFVLEHVANPERFLSELFSVLRPGGTFFFRTTNVLHYVGIVSALTSHSIHRRLANRLRNLPDATHDPWPTVYKMNRKSSLQKKFEKSGFADIEIRMMELEPMYLVFHPLAFLCGIGYERLVNSTEKLSWCRSTIFGRATKLHK